jgi:predicted AlkP superfamily phosphohydrolase/phosphomutase
MKTVLLGLDGATYTVLDDLVARGVMPNLARLLSAGSRGVLRSTPTPITPQAWTTLATGRSPGHHGIYDFIRPEAGHELVYFRVNNARDNHCETIWSLASRQGKRVTVLNYYGTAPPDRINGHVIPGFVSARHLRHFSHPRDLLARLEQAEGVGITVLGTENDFERQALKDMPSEQWCPWIRHHIERERAWFSVLRHLMSREPSDLTAIVLDGVDKIQHLAYRFLDPALVPDQPTPWEAEVIGLCRSYFKLVDEILGWTMSRIGRWGRVFVVSDHGFTATSEVVYINKWLHDNGMLQWKRYLDEDERHATFSDNITQLAGAIDLPNTRAYALMPSSNGIFLVVPPAQYHGFREDLVGRLGDLTGPDGGRVVTEVKRREEIFSGPYMESAPDLTLTLRDFGFVSVLNARSAVVPRPEPAGTHHPDGVLLGIGPGIREGVDLGMKNILDVAPLLLHSLGLDIPAAMEGVFPADMYDPSYLDSDPARVARETSPTEQAREEMARPEPEDAQDRDDEVGILERLRSLGYIE